MGLVWFGPVKAGSWTASPDFPPPSSVLWLSSPAAGECCGRIYICSDFIVKKIARETRLADVIGTDSVMQG